MAKQRFTLVDRMDVLPMDSGSVDMVYTNSVPLDLNTHLGPGPRSEEILRILREGGIWVHDGVVKQKRGGQWMPLEDPH